MNRIDPDQIVGLYQKHQINPIFGSLIREDKSNQEIYACGLGICLIDKIGSYQEYRKKFENEDRCQKFTPIYQILDLEANYVTSFTWGFDGRDFEDSESRHLDAFRDGCRTRALVIKTWPELKTKN